MQDLDTYLIIETHLETVDTSGPPRAIQCVPPIVTTSQSVLSWIVIIPNLLYKRPCSAASTRLTMVTAVPTLQFVDTSVIFPPIDRASCEIRLLNLLPSSVDGNIACELSVVPLSHCPSYEALSYVWGDQNDPATIAVNNHAFKVTRNLYKALINLIPESDFPRALWIDAVCVSQGHTRGELEERGHQVNLMGRIFATATSVTAFLGDPFPGLGLAMQYLALAAEEPDRHIDTSHHNYLCVLGVDANSAYLAKSLITMFNRRWWYRIWTLQEYVLARRVSFQFGKLCYSADTVTRGVLSLARHKSQGCCDAKISEAILYGEDGEEGTIWDSFQRPQWQAYARTHNLSLLHGLAIFHDLECIDPRDKVYALLGVFPDSPTAINPDYEVTPEQLFQDFSLAWANKERNLDFLGFVHGSSSSQLDLPTWAIDWTRRYKSSFMKSSWLIRQRALHNRFYNAHLRHCPVWTLQSPGRVIANGFLFDTITPGPVVPGGAFRPVTGWVDQYQWLCSSFDIARERGTAYECAYDAFLRTLCGDMLVIQDRRLRTEDAHAQHGVDVEKLLNAWWAEAFRSSQDVPGYPSATTSNVDNAVRVATIDMRFITTTKGYIGLAPADCLPGDVVAILGGSAVPVILRPIHPLTTDRQQFVLNATSGNSFEVVGGAYIHGIMDGEAFAICGRTQDSFDELLLI